VASLRRLRPCRTCLGRRKSNMRARNVRERPARVQRRVTGANNRVSEKLSSRILHSMFHVFWLQDFAVLHEAAVHAGAGEIGGAMWDSIGSMECGLVFMRLPQSYLAWCAMPVP